MIKCLNPDWEGGLEEMEHRFDKDGFCDFCGNTKEYIYGRHKIKTESEKNIK